MLARRFTIVCILSALFGMFLSMIVEENARTRRHAEVGEAACGEMIASVCKMNVV